MPWLTKKDSEMAMFDDRDFLIRFIRNSFITSDETGMCELILDTDDCPIKKNPDLESLGSESVECPSSQSISSLDIDTELSHSCDIVFDMELTGHRRRSDTAQRLDKLKRDKQKQSQIKHVQWRATCHSAEDVNEMFMKKDIVEPLTQRRVKSALSLQLDEFESSTANPFMEFAKFDGRAAGGMPTKTIDIFLTMAPPSERSYPMTVVTLSSAKVQQLIGLICWQYTTENREPPLSETNVNAYSLHMVEDDGEVDSDFPPLEAREPFSKFGFTKLALVVKSVVLRSAAKQPTEVIVHTADGANFTIPVKNSETVVMRDILNEVIDLRKLRVKIGQSYRLEKRSAPGVSVDLDLPVASTNATQFCLIRENSAWPVKTEPDNLLVTSDIMCHQYRSYEVVLLHKIRPSSPAQLGVSGDKVELDPAADRNSTGTGSYFSRRSLLFHKQKSMSIAIDSIASCFIRDGRTTTDRTVVRLVYSSTEGEKFKHCDMGCSVSVGMAIVSQIVNILNYRPNSAARNYVPSRDTKLLSRRHTTVHS